MTDADVAVSPWERQPREPTRAYSAFRVFRDLGPTRRTDAVAVDSIPFSSIKRWSAQWDWHDRAAAWDDEVHRIDDERRLEAIRQMHDTHQRAGRAAMRKALQALERLDPDEIPAHAAARLLELGARMERSMLLSSVEELQGVATLDTVDPWDQIARELTTVRDPSTT